MTPLRLRSNKSKIYGETNKCEYASEWNSTSARVKRSDMTANIVEQNDTSDKKISLKSKNPEQLRVL